MKLNKFYLLLSIIFAIFLWHMVALYIERELIFPTPLKTLEEFIRIVKSDDFLVVISHSTARILIGFAVSFSLACVLAFLSGVSKIVEYLIKPFLHTIKSTPTIAIILVVIIWLKNEKAPMFVSSLVCFPIAFSNVFEGMKTVDKKLLEMADVFNVGFFDKLTKIYLPHLKNYIFAGASTAISLSVKITITAEVLSQPYISIGERLQIERVNLNTAGVFAWAMVAIILAALFEFAIKIILKNKKQAI